MLNPDLFTANPIEQFSLVFVEIMTYITSYLFKNRKSGELWTGYTRLQLPTPRFNEKKYYFAK